MFRIELLSADLSLVDIHLRTALANLKKPLVSVSCELEATVTLPSGSGLGVYRLTEHELDGQIEGKILQSGLILRKSSAQSAQLSIAQLFLLAEEWILDRIRYKYSTVRVPCNCSEAIVVPSRHDSDGCKQRIAAHIICHVPSST